MLVKQNTAMIAVRDMEEVTVTAVDTGAVAGGRPFLNH
jgi:hypothetical protein